MKKYALLIIIVPQILLSPQFSSACTTVADAQWNTFLTYDIMDRNGSMVTTIETDRVNYYTCGEYAVTDRVENNIIVMTNDDNSKSMYDLNSLNGQSDTALSELNVVAEDIPAYGGDQYNQGNYMHSYEDVAVKVSATRGDRKINLTFFRISNGEEIKKVDVLGGYTNSSYYMEKNTDKGKLVLSLSPELNAYTSYADKILLTLSLTNRSWYYDTNNILQNTTISTTKIHVLVMMDGTLSYPEFSTKHRIELAENGLYLFNTNEGITHIWRSDIEGKNITHLFDTGFEVYSMSAGFGRLATISEGGDPFSPRLSIFDDSGKLLTEKDFSESQIRMFVLKDYIVREYTRYDTEQDSVQRTTPISLLTGLFVLVVWRRRN